MFPRRQSGLSVLLPALPSSLPGVGPWLHVQVHVLGVHHNLSDSPPWILLLPGERKGRGFMCGGGCSGQRPSPLPPYTTVGFRTQRCSDALLYLCQLLANSVCLGAGLTEVYRQDGVSAGLSASGL